MQLTLYTRPGCHLCEEMKERLSGLKTRQPFGLTEIDISTSPTLQRLYQHHIPVLLLDGEEIVRHRIGESELLALLDRR